MGKRKRTNGCLLSMLKIAIIGSFGLLMSFFGMYMLTMSWENDTKVTSSPRMQVATTKNIDKEQVQRADELTQEQPIMQEEPNTSKVVTEKKDIPTEKKAEEAVSRPVPEVVHEEAAIKESSTIPVQNTTEEVLQVSEEVAPTTTTVDIPVYNRYELNLSDYVIKEAEGVVKTGEINLTQLVSQYFSNMSTKEKLSLVNMLLGKMKNIDISYIWGIMADGITDEEVLVLQGLIEENFTEQEIDELYTYYTKSELAQLE